MQRTHIQYVACCPEAGRTEAGSNLNLNCTPALTPRKETGEHATLSSPFLEGKKMKVMMDFNRTLLLMPKPWLVWLALLVAANMVVPLFYITTREGQVVLVAILVGAVIQMVIFGAKGFVRLLGLGHILWVPMVPWLWTRLDQDSSGSIFGYWLLAVIVLDSLSLMIDVVDVIRYIKGERAPQLSLDRSE